jgi:MFS family permease
MAKLDIATLRAVPRGIWALGIVSLLMDTSSELIHSLLPIYLVGTLGASMTLVGVIEGIAEATASVSKLFSGVISDWFGRRKLMVVTGYGLAALTKPVFALATSVGWVFAARFVDRVGKGIRGAPRDALIADLSPPALRGASFGLRQSLDTVGAFLGPLIAIGLMLVLAGNIRGVFAFAAVPAALAVLVLIAFVREPRRPGRPEQARAPLRLAEVRALGVRYWKVVAIAGIFSLARFSDAFLILEAETEGLDATLAPAVLVLINVVYAASAYPAGVLSDNGGRVRILAVGLALLGVADLVLATTTGLIGTALGIALWGLHLGFTQGIFSTLVADTAPEGLRGTAFGLLNLVIGLALLGASLLAGVLWDAIGPSGTFAAAALIAALSFVALLLDRDLRAGDG